MLKTTSGEHEELHIRVFADNVETCTAFHLTLQKGDAIDDAKSASENVSKMDVQTDEQTVINEQPSSTTSSITEHFEIKKEALQTKESSAESIPSRISPLQKPDLVASINERPSDLPGVQSFRLGLSYSGGIVTYW